MLELHLPTWAFVTNAALLAGDVLATGHIVLFKRDNRAALGWIGLVWLAPVAGPLLYFLFGINRVRRKARRLRWRVDRGPGPPEPLGAPSPGANGLDSLKRLVGGVTGRPISLGNRVQPLETGEAAFTEMLTGIASAEYSIGLSTYIFDNDRTGRTFVEALSAATRRGVAVRVLIDDLGLRYSFPSIVRRLRAAGGLVADGVLSGGSSSDDFGPPDDDPSASCRRCCHGDSNTPNCGTTERYSSSTAASASREE